MTRLTDAWLQADPTRAVAAMLTGAGFRALFVGGCVRDALLGAPVGDIDIATDARPERVVELAAATGLKAVPTGMAHGTVTVVAHGTPFEVTTFRTDCATDGRHATVAFSDDVAEDARRRDFTINALYAATDGTLCDPLGGLDDLWARRVRFIGTPAARIREDYLRILRFFRFHAVYGDPDRGLDTAGLAACAALAEGIERLSRERIGAEMRKLLAAPDPAPSLAAMAGAGVLARVLPGAGTDALGRLVRLERQTGVSPTPLRRLAALGARAPGTALRLSKAEAATLGVLGAGIGSGDGPAALGYRHGAAAARDIVLLRAAWRGTAVPPAMEREAARGAAAEFPVAAADLMPRYSGRALGARLAELEDRWIASDFALSRAELLA